MQYFVKKDYDNLYYFFHFYKTNKIEIEKRPKEPSNENLYFHFIYVMTSNEIEIKVHLSKQKLFR